MLTRVFLGWLRGERGHCGMVAIPTIEEEDAKRPSRERENLIGERTRIINRMKSALARLGIRGFKPQLRKAPQLVEALRTPEDAPIRKRSADPTRLVMSTRSWLVRRRLAVSSSTAAACPVGCAWFAPTRCASARRSAKPAAQRC
jgi:transposase